MTLKESAMSKNDLHRETFLKGFLGFVSNDPTQKNIADQLLTYTKVMLASEGARVQTHTVMLLQYGDLGRQYVQSFAPVESEFDSLSSTAKLIRSLFFDAALDNYEPFIAWRTETLNKANENLERVFQTLQLSVVRQGAELETAFGFPWIETVTEKPGVCTLAMTQSNHWFQSVAVYVTGTPVTIENFMKTCREHDLSPRILND